MDTSVFDKLGWVPEPVIIYPLKAKGGSRWDNNELRYSLRSVDKHFRLVSGERAKVFILTTANLPWLDKDVATVVKVRGYADAIKEAWSLAREHSPTGDYVWMNDDICYVKDTTPADLFPMIHIGKMKPLKGETRAQVNGWRMKVCETRDRLYELGFDVPINFCTHSPYLFNADMMEAVAAVFGLKYKSPLETAYFNFYRDIIPNTRSKNRMMKHNPWESWKDMPHGIKDKRFLNYADRGLNNLLKGFLHGMFPNPSIYESQ